MGNYQTSNILFLEFSHSEVFQLYLPINAIFPMLEAVYLQTPDKRLLEIQYFFNFKCRVPMFEDPGATYSWDKIPAGWPERGLALMAIRKDIQFKHDEVIDQYASEHNRRFKFDWLFMNIFTLDTPFTDSEEWIPANDYVTPNIFIIIVQKSPKSLAAGAPPRPRWGSLQRSPRPPSCIGLGWRFQNFVPPPPSRNPGYAPAHTM